MRRNGQILEAESERLNIQGRGLKIIFLVISELKLNYHIARTMGVLQTTVKR